MNTHPILDRTRALLAAILALVLVLAGAVTATPAFAAGPALSAPHAPRAGGAVTVTGSGFSGTSPGIYLGVGPAGLAGFYQGSSQITDVVWIAPGNIDEPSDQGRTAPMTADGAFTVQVSVPAHSDGAQYAIYTSKAHGQGFADPSQNTVTALEWEPAPAVATTTRLTVDPAGSAVAGADFELGAVVEPAASGVVAYFDGTTLLGQAPAGAPLTARIATAGIAQLTAVFTPADPAAFAGSTSATVAYEITAPLPEPEPAAPKLTVSQTAGLDPDGQILTITAEDYDGSAASRYTPGKAGFYIQVGWLAPTWRPSEGAASSARTNAFSTWVADAVNTSAPTKWTENADGTVDATWTVEVSKAALDAKELPEGTLAVFTTGAGGVVQAAAEHAVPIAFAAPAPTLDVVVTDAAASAGATLEVTGTGFGDATGAYAAVIEKGTESAVTSGGGYVVFAYWAGAIVDGALERTLVAPTAKLDRTKQYEVIAWRMHTTPVAGTIYARADVPFTSHHWNTLFPQTVPNEPNLPSAPAPPPAPQGTGSLRWAISTSFSNYITQGAAHGSIAVTDGATRAGGVFQFGQAAGSTYDATGGTGNVAYTGAVRFTGHGGALDVTIADPEVRIASSGSATLFVTSGGSQVAFATLDLAAAARIATGGTVTYSKVPAALTAAGRTQVFQGFTTPLDPVTFTIGVPAPAPAGATGTVASAPPQAPARTIPATPPTATGIELDDVTLAALEAGEPVTVRASGFAPHEDAIQVVVYSSPTLLGEVSADASGTATWSGTLPATLADGEHTLTFQGSVDRGIRFTLARSTAAAGCVVDSASLRWGFKESFRTYLEGIAAGEWELTDVAYEYPDFAWGGGLGTVDTATRTGLVAYGGGIRFTGHGGALDTTLSNARIELARNTGYVVVDVTGTTQSGEPVTAAGVRFAEFAMPDLEVTDDGLVLDALPATLTDAGAAAFGTYAAGESLDPVSAVLPIATECAVEPAAGDAEAPVAEAAETDAATAEPTAPVWPWAIGGIALALGIGAVVWIVASRRRATAGGGGPDAD
ncbi:HtaA domain-containing protein [Microbacterium cremeum]|uniref:HtaA domain-containing protein n=1 Tax=Microbacterium cremeum TaxID=2782169 RepID=UPI0018896189|nr:HtaA domain-containing protein [Microbacterium cremeum]